MSGIDPTAPTPADAERRPSLTAFLDALGKSGLLGSNQERELIARSAGMDCEADSIAGWLVERGWLTEFQAGQFLAARGHELTLGSYRLLEPLGEGGMGMVFKARHALMDRVVALKLIRPEFVHDPNAVRRFRQEIRAAAQLDHPNLVKAHDAEEAGGRHFLVMEFCDGITLHDLVSRSGPLAVRTAREYVRQAALGLQHAFERGLTHRDVKPENLMLCGSTVKVLDFGLARLRPPDAGPGSSTREGAILGTPDYLAPEQAAGRADVRSDLYSLGCTLYFLLTARVPFPDGTLIEKCLHHKLDEPVPLERLRPEAPPAIGGIVRRLMAKDPADRFQTPAELAEALAHHGAADTGLRPPARPGRIGRRRLVSALLGIVLAVAIGCGATLLAAWIWRERPRDEEQQPPRTWHKSRTLPVPENRSAYGLAFSPDGQSLAGAIGHLEDAVGKPGSVRVWAGAGWDLDLEREVKSGPVTCIAYSPDGATLAWGVGHSGDENVSGEFTLWDVAKQKVRVTVPAHRLGVFALAFQPHGELLATSGREGKVLLWDATTGEARGELLDRKREVMALAFSADGKLLAAGSHDGSIHLWEVGKRKLLGPLPDVPAGAIKGLAFTPDGETLLAVTKRLNGANGEVLSWNVPQRRRLSPMSLGPTSAFCLALSPDGTTFLAGCHDRTARLHETASRRRLQTLEEENEFYCLAFAPHGRLLASGGWYRPIQLWEAR